MHIATIAERGNELLIAGEMREQAEFHLRIIRREEHTAGPSGHKRAADLPAVFRSDRYVLEVRVGAGQSPRGGDRLVERGVDEAALLIHK